MVLLPAAKKSEMAGEGTNKVVAKKATVVNGPVSPYKPSKIHLSSVNPYITCNLCKGYLIDATTIVECLHSCKYRISWVHESSRCLPATLLGPRFVCCLLFVQG